MMKKSNIEWCDFTWDPVTGCRNDCSFCESRKRLSHFKGDIRFHLSDERIHIDEERSLYVITTPLAKNGSSVPAPTGFYPTLHPYRLQQFIQKIKPANIWVCHSGDLFGEWIPTEWILQVFEAAKQAPWHNYMFLTMNPNRYEELLETGVLMPTDNFWYGTRLTERGNVFTADGYHTFLCIEPMRLFAERMEIPNVEWILLGGYGKLKRSWIESVMERKGNIPVFMIGSKLFKDVWRAPLIQEYPPLLYRPAEKTLPHCSECKYCYSVRQGKRGLWRACRHYKIVRQDKDSGGRHIPGRYAAVSPQWCPKRPETNWRFTKRV
jgi:protein gp37